ncbi:MAG: hypothetical protein WC554_04225 [Clostridia bacterium]
MTLLETIERVVLTDEDEYILCKDAKQAESMRVSTFNARRKMPERLIADIGIQKVYEDGKYFVRIFKRQITEAEHWKRDSKSGKLIPAPIEEYSDELKRIIKLMREDGRSEEEVKEMVASFSASANTEDVRSESL